MKKQLLLFVLLMIPVFVFAQSESKYLQGAVPMKDGKVVFSKKFEVPLKSKEQVYNSFFKWAQNRFNSDNSRVVYASKEDGDVAVVSKQDLIFKSNFIQVDKSLMSYRMTAECDNGMVKVLISAIRYEYNVGYQKEPEKYYAEEWITDEYALNRSNTKLNRVSGKFRKSTIDFVDSLYADIAKALNTSSSADAGAVDVADVKVAERSGYTSYNVDMIPETLQKMLPESILKVESASDVKFENAVWKGFGKIVGKQIANMNCSNADKISANTQYSISFVDKKSGEAWLIIDCVKMDVDMGDKSLLIGQVLKIWIK